MLKYSNINFFDIWILSFINILRFNPALQKRAGNLKGSCCCPSEKSKEKIQVEVNGASEASLTMLPKGKIIKVWKKRIFNFSYPYFLKTYEKVEVVKKWGPKKRLSFNVENAGCFLTLWPITQLYPLYP